MNKIACAAALAALFLLPGISSAGPVMTQTFDDPHVWGFGGGSGGAFPALWGTALGGPGGPADPYLRIDSTGGSGPQSRLTAINRAEWSGDYTAVAATLLEMDLQNFGQTDLSLRLVLLDLEAGVPVNGAISSAAFFLPAGSGWVHHAFDIGGGGLTALPFLGSTVAGALADVDELWLMHNLDGILVPGMVPAIAGSLGVDNISRNGVAAPTTPGAPEPAVLTLLLAGIGAAASKRLRSRS
jgi:hypothetical protein